MKTLLSFISFCILGAFLAALGALSVALIATPYFWVAVFFFVFFAICSNV